MYEVMTPNHLLFGRKLYLENLNWESDSEFVEPDLPKRTKYVESLIEHFWKCCVLNMLLRYEDAKKGSNRKISYFWQKMILYYYTKKNNLDKNGC